MLGHSAVQQAWKAASPVEGSLWRASLAENSWGSGMMSSMVSSLPPLSAAGTARMYCRASTRRPSASSFSLVQNLSTCNPGPRLAVCHFAASPCQSVNLDVVKALMKNRERLGRYQGLGHAEAVAVQAQALEQLQQRPAQKSCTSATMAAFRQRISCQVQQGPAHLALLI